MEDDPSHWSNRSLPSSFDPSEDPRKWCSAIRTKLKRADFDSYQIERLVLRGGCVAIELSADQVNIEE